MKSAPGTNRDDVVQRQARALGDPTRHAIFRYIDAAGSPVTVAELTGHFGLNHNAIRQHLAKLCDAGLVLEELAPANGPGRRPLHYRTAPSAAGAWGGESPYEQLAILLLHMLETGRSPRDVGFEAGRQLARRNAGHTPPGTNNALDALEALVARQGFAPRRSERGDAGELVLEQCPYAAAASVGADVVCELHRGLAEGMADALPGGLEITDLVARNPKRAGCRLRTTHTTR